MPLVSYESDISDLDPSFASKDIALKSRRKDAGELYEAIQRVLRQVEAEIQRSEGNGVKALNEGTCHFGLPAVSRPNPVSAMLGLSSSALMARFPYSPIVLGTHDPIHLSHSEQQDDCQPFDSESVKAPLVYASVSRHWRSVALNTPALYTSLCITPELLREVGNTEVLETIGLSSYLALSRDYLVDIVIDARDQEWDFGDTDAWFSADHMSAAMSVLLPHLGRWRSLSILTDVYDPMGAALRPLEVHLAAYGAPHLESLRLMRCDAYAAHSSITNPESVLPNLRHFTLRGVPAAWAPLAALLPEHLSTLELSFQPLTTQPSIAELARLLKAAPNLARLVLNGCDSALAFLDPAGVSLPIDLEPIHLPSLKSLTLGYTSTLSALAVLHLLAAAQLRTLALEDASHPAELALDDAAPLLTALFPPSTPTVPLFPALSDLTLRRVHLAGPTPPVRVARLELVDMTPAALAFECTQELCVHGPLIAPSAFGVPTAVSLAETGTAPRALVEGRGATTPRVVCLHEAAYAPAHAGEVEEFFIAATRVKLYRRPEEVQHDDDTVMGSDPECGMSTRRSGLGVSSTTQCLMLDMGKLSAFQYHVGTSLI
ncbi:hypothetical protein B0H16DRAFT_1448632 [Mycena metata]|uniref:F-box domain-containing protein n=1 Tax=Mycena metata TaxID=1033252 RepID=A0AAD7NXD7_9AGAR|nr:hypothetical protein B0H16DRAFT_1448632 [Mycena metata]